MLTATIAMQLGKRTLSCGAVVICGFTITLSTNHLSQEAFHNFTFSF